MNERLSACLSETNNTSNNLAKEMNEQTNTITLLYSMTYVFGVSACHWKGERERGRGSKRDHVCEKCDRIKIAKCT